MKTPFEIWLRQNGAEIIPPTNEYELIRFKGTEIGVMFKSGKFSNGYAKHAHHCFQNKLKWDGRPLNIGRKSNYSKQKLQLLKRDGHACFYCGELLNGDVTVEHLIPLTAGGTNYLSNMVLTHEACNLKAGHKTIVEKVCMALKLRTEKLTPNYEPRSNNNPPIQQGSRIFTASN